MSKIRVAIICENYPPDTGGIATSAKRIALSLSSRVVVHVVCFPRGNPDQPRSHLVRREAENLFIHEVKPFVNGWTIPPDPKLRATVLHQTSYQVASILSAEQIDIIHGFGLQNAGLVAARVSHLLGVPLIQSARGNDVGRNAFDGTRRKSLELALANAKVVVAVNRWIAQLLKRHFPWIAERVRIINNGVESLILSSDPFNKNKGLASLLGLSTNAPVVGFVGTLREKKGPHLFSILVRDFISVHNGKLIIIGNADLELFHEIGWLGGPLNDNFVIIKSARKRTELYSLIGLCDWLVFPSLDDGMANGLLEAMACCRPVICSPVFSDVVRHWQDGILASPFNPSAYVSICEMLWKNFELRRRLGESARQRVKQKFSGERENKAWVDLYNKINVVNAQSGQVFPIDLEMGNLANNGNGS